MHPQNTAQFLYQAITSEFQTINISTPYLFRIVSSSKRQNDMTFHVNELTVG